MGLFIDDPTTGTWTNARTGATIPAPPFMTVRKVIANDMVTGAIATAVGVLDLASPNVGTRRAAAEAIFESPSPATLPIVTQALSHETNAGVITSAPAGPGGGPADDAVHRHPDQDRGDQGHRHPAAT